MCDRSQESFAAVLLFGPVLLHALFANPAASQMFSPCSRFWDQIFGSCGFVGLSNEKVPQMVWRWLRWRAERERRNEWFTVSCSHERLFFGVYTRFPDKLSICFAVKGNILIKCLHSNLCSAYRWSSSIFFSIVSIWKCAQQSLEAWGCVDSHGFSGIPRRGLGHHFRPLLLLAASAPNEPCHGPAKVNLEVAVRMTIIICIRQNDPSFAWNIYNWVIFNGRVNFWKAMLFTVIMSGWQTNGQQY